MRRPKTRGNNIIFYCVFTVIPQKYIKNYSLKRRHVGKRKIRDYEKNPSDLKKSARQGDFNKNRETPTLLFLS